jgi:FkbM family methyltransferase
MIGSRLLIRFYQSVFARRRFYRLNRALFCMAARGMGVLNSESDVVSGEAHFLKRLARNWSKPVVLDIGANVGHFSARIKSFSPDAQLFAFEPHPRTFLTLKRAAEEHGFEAIQAACGDATGRLKLFDYGDTPGSQHATLHSEVMTVVHKAGEVASWDVDSTTVDDFVKSRGLERIDLLKIDTEGHELSVLHGARQVLEQKLVSVIQFEFTEIDAAKRIFLRDFIELLSAFRLYRMLPDGIVALEIDHTLLTELFAYQNIAAIRLDLAGPTEELING